MSEEKHETTYDILAEMRSPRPVENRMGDVVGEIKPSYKVLEWADRLEAALKREIGNAATKKKKRRRRKRYDPAKFLQDYWRDHYEV